MAVIVVYIDGSKTYVGVNALAVFPDLIVSHTLPASSSVFLAELIDMTMAVHRISNSTNVGQKKLRAPNYETSNPYLTTGYLPEEKVASWRWSEVEPIYVTSTDHSVANTLSLSVRDSQTNAFLTSSVPSSSTIITNSDLLNSVQSSTVGSSGTVNNLPAGTVPYVQIENSDIGIINPNISFEQGTSVTANQNSFVKTKEPLSKIRSVIVNISKCSVCGKEFASKNTLKQHIKSNHPGLHFCTVCFDAFTTKDHLNTHKMQQHKSSNSCPECNRYFTTKHALNQHRLKEHNVVTNYSCDHKVNCVVSSLDHLFVNSSSILLL
ncbi:hypothetical protein Avbf_05568 [Armadillidium vulgare]|nr:hypothetical protein Avbf_05568 [Armadillidium vulgare]